MPKIQNYCFGRMIIDGENFSRDLMLTPTRVIPNWWRKEGHRLHLADLQAVLDEFQPETLVIGTGKFGLMKIPDDVLLALQSRKIEVIVLKTDLAAEKFNELQLTKNILGAFHLTC